VYIATPAEDMTANTPPIVIIDIVRAGSELDGEVEERRGSGVVTEEHIERTLRSNAHPEGKI